MKKFALLIIITLITAALLCSCRNRMDEQNGNGTDTNFAETNGDSMFDKNDGTINDTDTDGFINDTNDLSNDAITSPDTTNAEGNNSAGNSGNGGNGGNGNDTGNDTSIIDGVF